MKNVALIVALLPFSLTAQSEEPAIPSKNVILGATLLHPDTATALGRPKARWVRNKRESTNLSPLLE